MDGNRWQTVESWKKWRKRAPSASLTSRRRQACCQHPPPPYLNSQPLQIPTTARHALCPVNPAQRSHLLRAGSFHNAARHRLLLAE